MEKYYRHKELVGKEVYDSKAKRIGKVCDVGYSKEGKIALIVELNEGKEEIIPFDFISEVGDIVLLEKSFQLKQKEIEAKEKLCPKCGRKNEPKARFCVKCGYKF